MQVRLFIAFEALFGAVGSRWQPESFDPRQVLCGSSMDAKALSGVSELIARHRAAKLLLQPRPHSRGRIMQYHVLAMHSGQSHQQPAFLAKCCHILHKLGYRVAAPSSHSVLSFSSDSEVNHLALFLSLPLSLSLSLSLSCSFSLAPSFPLNLSHSLFISCYLHVNRAMPAWLAQLRVVEW